MAHFAWRSVSATNPSSPQQSHMIRHSGNLLTFPHVRSGWFSDRWEGNVLVFLYVQFCSPSLTEFVHGMNDFAISGLTAFS